MLKNVFFLAALLAPGLAYGGNPSADLSVQVTPGGTTSTQCPSTAPAEAVHVGFTAMVLCNDFTQPLPNSAGTTTDPNYWGCVGHGTGGVLNGQVWWPQSSSVGCSDFDQEVDSTTGQLTQHIQFLASQYAPGVVGWNQYATDDGSGNHVPGQGHYLAFPLASLIEYTIRDNLSSHQNCGSNQNSDWWNGVHESQSGVGVFERDVIENYGPGMPGVCQNWTGFSALHNWNVGGQGSLIWGALGGCPQAIANKCTDPTWFNHYHTYGMLTTTDGSTGISNCGYVDHIFMGCAQFNGDHFCLAGSPNQAGCYGEREQLTMIVGSDGQGCNTVADCTANPRNNTGVPPGDIHVYIESIRVWSCPAWNAGGDPRISNPGVNTCYSNIFSGENASKVPPKTMLADATIMQWAE
jgi:hypothetical protein